MDISKEKRDKLIKLFKERLADILANNKKPISKGFELGGQEGVWFEKVYKEAKDKGSEAWSCRLQEDYCRQSFPEEMYGEDDKYRWRFNCDPFNAQLRGYIVTNENGEICYIDISPE